MDITSSNVDVFPLFLPVVAFFISFVTSMGGVSGAFLLLPFQVSVLGFTSPAVSPTNLVYNIVATPSGVYRYIREGRMAWPVTWAVILGTLPGVFVGVIVRIKYFPDPRSFKMFVGCVLLYIGLQLLYQAAGKSGKRKNEKESNMNDFHRRMQRMLDQEHAEKDARVKTVHFSAGRCEYDFWGERFKFNPVVLFIISLLVGIVGGTYGIGGGSIIAPFCIAVLGLPVYTIAGAALFGTFLTSIVGVLYYYIVSFYFAESGIAVTPDWTLGLLFGIGGFIGMYCGARTQKYVPERLIKLVLGMLITFLSYRYIVQYFT
ncbi:sulfite exporter TauE/SafE family protein [candidate division KSB1 bacterium]